MNHPLRRGLTTTALLLSVLFGAQAQTFRVDTLLEAHRERLRLQAKPAARPFFSPVFTTATAVGIGAANVLDTYLSPYAYTGTNLRLHGEMQRATRLFSTDDDHPRLTLQTLADLDFSFLQNPAKNVDEWAGGVRLSAAGLYRFATLAGGRLELSAGPMLSLYLGGIYNDRNGNNPAQAKLSLMLDATAAATFRFRLLKRNAALRYQLAVPLLGAAFSPNYGQSYYEAFSLGNYDHNAVLATPANAPSLRQLLTLDLPINARRTTAIRVGYVGNLMQSEFNNLRYHSYTHSFMIGISKSFMSL